MSFHCVYVNTQKETESESESESEFSLELIKYLRSEQSYFFSHLC